MLYLHRRILPLVKAELEEASWCEFENLNQVFVGWVKRYSPNDVQFHVSLWKPNAVQDSMRRA